MNRLQSGLRKRLAAAYVPAVSLLSVLCAAALAVLPAPSVAAIDCWVDAEVPSTGDQRWVRPCRGADAHRGAVTETDLCRHAGRATVPSGQSKLLPSSGPRLCRMARRRCTTGSYGR